MGIPVLLYSVSDPSFFLHLARASIRCELWNIKYRYDFLNNVNGVIIQTCKYTTLAQSLRV